VNLLTPASRPQRSESEFPFSSTGIINYSPLRNSSKFSMERICVVDVDEELSAYYRKMWTLKNPHIPILKPSWSSHISIMRGSRILDKEKPWGYKEGLSTEFYYSPYLEFNEKHLWINVLCPVFFELRAYYNVPIRFNHGHITIAKFR
jgi:hypothetical protein